MNNECSLDYELYKLLDTNGFVPSEKNLNELKEGLENGKYAIFAYGDEILTEGLSKEDRIGMLLEANGYESDDFNRELFSNMKANNCILFLHEGKNWTKLQAVFSQKMADHYTGQAAGLRARAESYDEPTHYGDPIKNASTAKKYRKKADTKEIKAAAWRSHTAKHQRELDLINGGLTDDAPGKYATTAEELGLKKEAEKPEHKEEPKESSSDASKKEEPKTDKKD